MARSGLRGEGLGVRVDLDESVAKEVRREEVEHGDEQVCPDESAARDDKHHVPWGVGEGRVRCGGGYISNPRCIYPPGVAGFECPIRGSNSVIVVCD